MINELLKVLVDNNDYVEPTDAGKLNEKSIEDESDNAMQIIVTCNINNTSKIQKYLNKNYKVKDFKIANGYAYDNDCGHINHIDPTICAILEREE